LPFGSYNTVYAFRYAYPNCAFGTTSHTPKPLGEIGRWLKKKILKVEKIYIYEYEAKAV